MKTFIFLMAVSIAMIFVSILTRVIMFSILNPGGNFKDNIKKALFYDDEADDGRTFERDYYVF
jgi:hypothetical protein